MSVITSSSSWHIPIAGSVLNLESVFSISDGLVHLPTLLQSTLCGPSGSPSTFVLVVLVGTSQLLVMYTQHL